MNENIFWVFETEVSGDLEKIVSLMDEMTEYTKANAPGTLFFELYISEDNKKVTLFERFDNSASALAQATIFRKNFAMRYMENLKPKKFTVFGNPDETLKAALDKLGSVYMIPIGGFSR